MFRLIMIIAAVTIMVKAADMENRSPFSWGMTTFLMCVLCGLLIPLPLINIAIGLVISFLAMFVVKLVSKE